MDNSQRAKHAPDGWDCARFWSLVLSFSSFRFRACFSPVVGDASRWDDATGRVQP